MRAKPKLKLVRPKRQAREREETRMVPRPEGVPDGAELGSAEVGADLDLFGVQEGDLVVTWDDAPVTNYDFVYVMLRDDSARVGRYHSAPGGYVRLEDDDEAMIFKPSEVQLVARVMETVRDRRVIRRFPLK